MTSFNRVRVFIGLGSNLGNRTAQVKRALGWLAAHPEIELKRHTRLVQTEAWGVTDQPAYINAVAEIYTGLGPDDLLEELKSYERQMGREPGGPRWGPREIDLDILLYGDLVKKSRTLEVPHAHLTERRFVVEQIVELDAELIHPELRVPIRSFL